MSPFPRTEKFKRRRDAKWEKLEVGKRQKVEVKELVDYMYARKEKKWLAKPPLVFLAAHMGVHVRAWALGNQSRLLPILHEQTQIF